MSVEDRQPSPFSSDLDKVRRSEPVPGAVQSAEFRCQICGQVFTNQADLDEHVKSHERVEEKVENEEIPPAGVS